MASDHQPGGTSHLFYNARIIDGTGAPARDNAWLLVKNGRIADIGVGEAPRNAAERHDLGGMTLMPGLMDAHVHPANLDVDLTTVPRYRPAVFVHKVSRILERDLALGFTTLRDAGGLEASFRDAVNQGFINGPRLFLSLSPLTQTGGHADKRDATQSAPIPRNSLGLFPLVCDSPDAMRRAAREMLRQGANQVKVMADGGVMSPTGGPGHPQFSVPELRAAVEAAEAAGSYVLAHVYCSAAVRNCLEAGVRSIEHATLMDEATIALMAEKGAFFVPTLCAFELMAEKGEEMGLKALWRDKHMRVCEGALRSLEYAHKAGVRIASGSDIIGPFQEYKGRELALKARVLGAMGAIVAATRTTAELMRVDDMLGTLEKGKLADCIVVRCDPLENLACFEPDAGQIAMVMKEGVVVRNTGGL